MTDVEIVLTKMRHVAGFNAAVDAVARERRYLSLLEGPSLASSSAFVSRLLAGAGVQFLALHEGRVVGWCDVVAGSLEGSQRDGRLGMGLLPPYRGLGLGQQLAAATISGAKDMGIRRVELDVFASNERALRLYERLGFVREGVGRRAHFLDGRHDDIVQMSLLFADPGGKNYGFRHP